MDVQPVAALAFTVNSTGDSPDVSVGDGTCLTATAGECTLRAAIQEANVGVASDTISFAIGGAGPHKISPLAPLPPVSFQTIIDGYSQVGAIANSSANSFAPTILVELDGSNLSGARGIELLPTAIGARYGASPSTTSMVVGSGSWRRRRR